MNKRVQWRAVMLVTMATIAFGLSVRSYAATTPAATAGPTIERYNPYIDGDRLVFTQVTRQPDDSTTAAIWTRDLVTGRESLVADVQTGEPMPVTNRSWTAWSEMVSDTHSVVRARSNRGGAVIDVFTTAASPFPGGGNDDPDRFLPSVSVTDDRLVTTNGTFVDLTMPEVVRFDLPSTRPTYVDVLTTTEGVGKTWVSTAKGATVMSDLGPPQLFFVLDNGGKLVSSPIENCTAGFTEDQSQAVIDGRRVAMGLVCDDLRPSIATCLLPCRTVDIVRLQPFSIFGAPRVALSGDVVAFNRPSPFFGGSNAVMVMDLSRDTEPTAIRTTDGAIGPRVTISGNRVAWDETNIVNGRRQANLYVYDRATKHTTVIDGNGGSSTLGGAAPVRLAPDVESGQIAYNALNPDGTESGIWVRSLTGRPQLVSVAATDGSAPVIGDRYVAWNRKLDESGLQQQVVAARRDGRGPALDVFTTDATAPPVDLGSRVRLDMDGDRAIISAVSTDTTVSPHGLILSGQVGTAAIAALTPPPVGFDTPTDERLGRGDNGTTVAIGSVSVDPPSLIIYDRQRGRSVVPLPPFCSHFDVAVEGPRVVTASNCFFGGLNRFETCTLPCASPTITEVARPTRAGLDFPFPIDMDQANGKVIVRSAGSFGGGRYLRSRFLNVNVMQLVDLTQPTPTATIISIESGRTSPVRMDGDLAVWSVDRIDGVRTGTVFVYDVRKGTTTAL